MPLLSPFDFIICCVYTALLFIRPQDWIPFLNKVHVLDAVAGAGMLAVLLRLLNPAKVRPWHLPQSLLIILFWAAAVASFVVQFFASEVLSTFQVIGKIVLAFALVLTTADSRRKLDGLFVLLLFCTAFLCFHCTLQKFTGTGLGGQPPAYSPEGLMRVRAFGIFSGPNEMGTIAAIGIVICFSFLRRFAPVLPVWFLLVPGVLFFGATLWWTVSRQAVLILAAGTFALFFRPGRTGFAMLAAGAAFFMALQYHPRFRLSALGQDDSVDRRVSCVTGGLRVFRRHPLLGVGRGRARDEVGMHMPLHNSYVQILAENGLIGFSAFVGILVCSGLQLVWFLQAKPETVEERAEIGQARLLFALLAVICVAFYFQNRAYHVDGYVYLGMMAAFSLNMLRKYGGELPGYFRIEWLWSMPGVATVGGASLGLVILAHVMSRLYWMLY